LKPGQSIAAATEALRAMQKEMHGSLQVPPFAKEPLTLVSAAAGVDMPGSARPKYGRPLMAIFAIGVHRTVQPTRHGMLGIVLLFASCLGLMIAGLFPWIMVNGVPTETKPHVVGAILSFSGASTGFIALSRRLSADARWRSLAPYVLTTGLVMLILFVVLGAFAIEDGTPLHPWAGLLQRVVVFVWFACTTTIAFMALRIERNAGRARAA